MDLPTSKAVGEFWAQVEVTLCRSHHGAVSAAKRLPAKGGVGKRRDSRISPDGFDRDFADAWVVVVVDDEDGEVSWVEGCWDTPEEALQRAAELDADPDGGKHPRDGDVGWSHHVIPFRRCGDR